MSKSKPEPNPYTAMVEKAFADAIPLSCQFEITYRCNHLCTFCYNSPTGQPELSTEQIFAALRKIADFGLLYVTLTGGEAMCHKDFFEIAAEVRRLGMALRVYTNGYLLADMQKVRRIKAFSPMEVEVSIHGARPETHDALTRIRGSFDKTWQAIANLSAEGIKINLKCPITKLNQDELFGVRDLAASHGLLVNFDAVITPKDDGDVNPLSLRPDPEFLERYWGEWYSELHGGKLPPRSNHCAADDNANCGTGRSGFTVDPYGNIFPCIALRRKVANILEIKGLDQIWSSSPVLLDVRQLAVDARKRLDQHDNGPYFSFCPGVAEVQTGDPLQIYPQAEENARAVRRHYELLQIEEPESRANSA
jgi:MoaA/NifB/PqqE/SkfB family radical SAM enzyme